MRYQRAEPPLKLDGIQSAREYFYGCIKDAASDREGIWVAHLDDQARCLHVSQHSGDEIGASFPIRQILADALLHGSAGIVLAHNHPSGNPKPSQSDCRATRRLATAAEAIDCTVVDHLVFGGAQCSSLRQMGLL